MRIAIQPKNRNYRRQQLTLPAPVMGWNKRDNYISMAPQFARAINNLVIEGGYVETRKGYILKTAITEALPETVMGYDYNGAQKLLCAAGGILYDCDYTEGAKTSLNETPFLSSRFNDVFYKGNLYLLNGQDPVQVYDGESVSAANFSSWDETAPLNLNLLKGGALYKNRLFFIERETLAFWYTQDAGNIQGPLVKFDLSQLSKYGGSLKIIIPWTYSSSGTQESQLLFVTSEGEIFVYAGDNPSEIDSWALRGTYKLARPISDKSAVGLGGDVVYASETGYYLLSQLLSAPAAEKTAAFSDAINPVLQEVKSSFKNYGWQAKAFQADNILIINVPFASAEIQQHVLNLQTGAWTRFTGIAARCWAELSGKLYFCGNGGLYQAQIGYSDNGKQINWDFMGAYNSWNYPMSKLLKELEMYYEAYNSAQFEIYASVDFKRESIIFKSTPPAPESEWDVAEWDKARWASESYALRKRITPQVSAGSFFSMGVSGSVNGQKFRILGIDLFYEASKNLT